MKKASLQTIARDVRAIAVTVGAVKPGKADLKLVHSKQPATAKGEIYAGIVLGKKGERSYHLIKLPREMPSKDDWDAAGKWAASVKGALPTRREQALMFANIAEEFQTDTPYWSCEEHAGASSYAWCQWFNHGSQGYWTKASKLRACAVRRVFI